MTYDLVIGDRAYSSWSLRGWLFFDAFDIPVRTHSARLYTDDLPTLFAAIPPRPHRPHDAHPRRQRGAETIAIAEELATRHPDAGLWAQRPARPRRRPRAGRRNACRLHRAQVALPDEPACQLYRLRPARCRAGRSGTVAGDLGLGRGRKPAHKALGFAAITPPPMPSSPLSPPASPPTTCPSARQGWIM